MREAQIKRLSGEVDNIITYSVEDFPIFQLNRKALKCKHKKNRELIYVFATFDIETTTIAPDNPEETPFGFMYHWQMCIGGIVVTGRRWEEWIKLLNHLIEYFRLNNNRRLIIYIHNEAFEFQFMKDFLKAEFGELNIFARASHKPIYVSTSSGLEFRCSYVLTNMSLAKACENERGLIHGKAEGDLDYRIRRTPDTPISDVEFGYCVSDVVCLYELIENRLKNEKDNLESIPLTSTGYVRRDCRESCRKDRHYHDYMLKLILTEEVYLMLKEAGRGGNTHANRYMAGRIWHNADSYDVQSSYPAQMCLKQYPVTNFSYYGELDDMDEFKDQLAKYACLLHIEFKGLKVKKSTPMPYIPISKALAVQGEKLDNGRVLNATYLKMCITDIDYKIIEDEYTWEAMAISDLYRAHYGYLPSNLLDVVKGYFTAKTELKAKIEAIEDEDSDELANYKYLYAKSKNRLNGIFGMCYTDPIRPTIVMDENGVWSAELPNLSEALEKTLKSRNNFLFYAWGVWITAHARAHLEALINATNRQDGACIYVDTDSSKCLNPDKSEIERINGEIIKECERLGAYADAGGKRYYMGVYEHENAKPIKDFVTLGAKKYAYTDEKGFHITISGVEKKKGAKEMGAVENFKPGFIFKEAGGLTLYYVESDIHTITIDGCTFTTASNVGMVESTYELGITGEYAEVIGYNIYLDKELI